MTKKKSVRAAKPGEQPSATERFLDNFGTLLQVCFKPSGGNLERLAILIGPNNVARLLNQHKDACVEFFGRPHEYYEDIKVKK